MLSCRYRLLVLSTWFCSCAARTTRGWQCPTGRGPPLSHSGSAQPAPRASPPALVHKPSQRRGGGRGGGARGEFEDGVCVCTRQRCQFWKGTPRKESLGFWVKEKLAQSLSRKPVSLRRLLEACLTKTGHWGQVDVPVGRLHFTSQWGREVRLIANSLGL